jgi:hypothetical protein
MNEVILAFFFDNPNKSSGLFFNRTSMDKYWSSVLLILTSDSLLTSTPDPTGEKQKHTRKGKQHSSMASMHKQ